MKKLIQKLTETFSPSGSESAIREVIRSEVEALADEVRVDALGNLIVRKGTKGKNGKRIMLAAHMDEIGLMVTHIDENGFIRFTSVGGVLPHTMLSGRVHFGNGTQGVIGMEKYWHVDKLPGLRECYIDIGATSARDCPVKVGDVAAFERPFLDLGGRLVAKSMDDRIGCAVLIETLRTLENQPARAVFRLHHPGGSRHTRGRHIRLRDRPGDRPGGGRHADRRHSQGPAHGGQPGQGPGGQGQGLGHAGRPARGGMDVFHGRKEAHPLPARGARRRHHGRHARSR